MKRKKASEIFASVDPKLKVIDGGVRKHGKGSGRADWEKAGGVSCSRCGKETVRMIDGICFDCHMVEVEKHEEETGRKTQKRRLVRAFNQGRITYREMREGRL